MRLSVVTTLYHSAEYLEEFHERVCKAAERVTDDYEIIFVNDGSPDDSQEVVTVLCSRDPRCRAIELSRNFGHYKAIMTGLEDSTGDLVFLVDCDLEEEPEWLSSFNERLQERNVDVVYGVQERRKGGWFERFSGFLFYKLANAVCEVDIPRNVVTARLMRRDYVDALVEHRDREVFLPGLWATTGYRQDAMSVTKGSRPGSTYNLSRKLGIVLNSVTSFSARPLFYVFCLGLFIAAITSMSAAFLIFRKLFFGGALSGWTSLIVSIWLLGGLTICCVGVVGLYVAKTFSETKRRPYTIVRSVTGLQDVSRATGRGSGNSSDAA